MLNQLRVDQVFHAIGDPTRRKLVEQLSRGPASVSDLARPLGITLAAVVQHLMREAAPGVPVVLISGYGTEEALRQVGHGQAAAVLQKPFTPSQLLEALARLATYEGGPQ